MYIEGLGNVTHPAASGAAAAAAASAGRGGGGGGGGGGKEMSIFSISLCTYVAL